MKTITLQRSRNEDTVTIGLLRIGKSVVATLEDPVRDTKIYGETAIPAGCYTLELRNEGGKTKRYEKRFPDMHKGMIWLRDVPNFTYVYIHIGNYAKDTDGCILVGEKANKSSISNSTKAYKRLYPKIVKMIESEGCQIEIIDKHIESEGNHSERTDDQT